MAPYHHTVSTHRKSQKAKRLRKMATLSVMLALVVGAVVGIDWLLTQVKSTKTVVSSESNATVQSARINIFQTPYFRFQADASWREVSDELNLSPDDKTKQYLYRSYDKNFIEHELWVTIDLPDGYFLQRHNVPTRVMPVAVNADGSLSRTDMVSGPCVEVLGPNPNLEPKTVKQDDVEYFCNPDQVNDYTVAVGEVGGTNKLKMPQKDGTVVEIAITYRNVTPNPDARQLESILQSFRSM
ncbi:MAG TPA: hypothetical protein PKD15_05965 [Candidatus Saccharibacteria bacterium]|jgi:hypothetical protein|nr:hypothetical protein [Candidatus Saccharibacteria bacterium]